MPNLRGWEFSGEGSMWLWRYVDPDTGAEINCTSAGFPTLPECIEDAEQHGFDGTSTRRLS